MLKYSVMTTTIDPTENSVSAAFRAAVNRGARPEPQKPAAKTDKTENDRTVHDTVTLSAGGQKIVNLARGAELSRDIKAAPIDETFAGKLKDASDDVFRIAKLFGGTLRALFSRGR